MNIFDELKKQLKEQEALLVRLEKRTNNARNPQKGFIKASHKHGSYQFYFKGKNDSKYRYVPVSEKKKIGKILQGEYEEVLLKTVRKNCAVLRHAIRNLIPVEDRYERMSPGKKELIDPIISTRQSYIDAWYRKYPGGMNPYFEEGVYQTDRGEKVRSKSEKILADLFYKREIPYQYEPEITLKDGSKVYPDFLLLNVRERRTFIWEHFGMLSDDDYAKKNMRKICSYDESGFSLGVGLLISSESDEVPLKLSLINEKIDRFLV